MRIVPKIFILDVDGVMTDGKLYYTRRGKEFKVFGPDDHDALSLLKPYMEVRFVTGDKRGLPISRRRIVSDMKMPLDLVSTVRRLEWIAERYDPREVVYMGDGIFDPFVFGGVGYSIATADADESARRAADYVTRRRGGERAVAEAALHLLKKFFTPFNPRRAPKGLKASGRWQA